MISLLHKDGTNVTFTNGSTSMDVFASSPAADTLSLLSTTQEEPSTTHISWPGEYDFDGIAVIGIGHDNNHMSYTLQFEQTRTAFVVDPVHDWTSSELERLGNIDILVLPATEGKLAQKLVDEIEPRVLIITPTGNEEHMEATRKACGAQGHAAVSEFKTKASLPVDVREVFVFG